MKEIADRHGAYLLSDMAHISGLVAGEAAPNLFEHSDIVTTTTQKALQGNRGALIFYRKGVRKETKKGKIMYDLEDKINGSVFPGHQGGPHNHSIAGICATLKLAQTSEFKEYQAQVVKNAKTLSESLNKMGYPTVEGSTKNHMALINVKAQNLDGARVDTLSETVNITLNKNVIPGKI